MQQHGVMSWRQMLVRVHKAVVAHNQLVLARVTYRWNRETPLGLVKGMDLQPRGSYLETWTLEPPV